MHKFETLVKNQISWMESQVGRFPPGHPRHRPEQIAMYERLIRDHLELLAFLQGLPDGAPSAGALVIPPAAAKIISQELSGLPPELLKELSSEMTRVDSDPLVQIIDARGGIASLDDILIDLYRKRGEVNKRTLLANRLYRLSKRHLVWIAPGRKGIYSTRPFSSQDGETPFDRPATP